METGCVFASADGLAQRLVACTLPAMEKVQAIVSPKHQRLGGLLREARVAAQVTQTEMAAFLGRKQSFVSKYELGTRGLDTIDFLLIVEFLECDIDHIVQCLREGQ